jgi:hypothetical protein
MNDMESRKFEDAFRDAFKEAEVTPTENVWTNIELDLEKAEGDKMKRRIFFYKLLAAASIAFAMSVAGVGYYILQDQQRFDGSLAVNSKTQPSSSEHNAQTRTGETAGQETENIADDSNAGQTISSDQSVVNGQPNSATANEQAATASRIEDGNTASERNATDKSIASLNAPDKKASADSRSTSNNNASVSEGASQSRVTQRQAKANGSSSNTENANRTSDQANNNSTTKANQKNFDTNKQNYTAENAAQNSVASTEGKQGNNQRNAQATESNGLTSDESAKNTNAIVNKSSQQVAANDAAKSSGNANEQNKNQSITEGNNVTSVHADKTTGQEVNSKTMPADNSANAGKQSIASNERATSNNNEDNALVNNTSAIANNKQQGVAAVDNKNTVDNNPAGDKNGVDINPFSRYYTANHGEFGAVNNASTLASNGGVKKLPSRVEKPVDFDATKLAPQVDPLMLMLARLDEEGKGRSEEQKKDESNNAEKLWTSVGFAAGSFNTVNSNASTSQSFAMNNVANQQAKASGSSYTVGLSMGTRLSKRWIVQGGVNYMTQSSDYTSNAVDASADFENFSAPAVNSIMSEADSRIVPTAPYTINSSLRYVSIPLQAGYMIVNKRFGVQLNGGVSTDMFLQNTLTPETDNVSKTTQGSGEDSPYRTFNFSGLVGTEFSYKFGQHYRLALNPGIRYPFSSIYKSDQPITAMPLTFDVGLRFRYIFH